MGGHALKGFECIRLDRESYFKQESIVIKTLQCLLPNRQILRIPAYKTKPSFGDMDLIVESQPEDGAWLYEQIIHAFQSRAFFKNGNIFSFEYQRFQIDLIFESLEYMHLAQAYFSWNDRGNLIGKLYHRFGLSYGHHGLKYKRYHEKRMFKEILVSQNLHEIWSFLGLSFDQDLLGFERLEDMFSFICHSPYFDLRYYQYENLNNESKSRDCKRKTYQAFLDFCQSKSNGLPQASSSLVVKEDFQTLYPRLCLAFDGFQARYEQVTQEIAEDQQFRSKFNGQLITELTGLSHQALGQFISSLKASYPTTFAFQKQINSMSTEEIQDLILRHACQQLKKLDIQ